MKDEKYDLHSLYWIPKLLKSPYKQCYIAEAANCLPNSLSKLLIYILTAV